MDTDKAGQSVLFEIAKQSLDEVVAEIISDHKVDYKSLDKETMMGIINFLGNRYRVPYQLLGSVAYDYPRLVGKNNDVPYYEIGYRLIKNHLQKISTLPEEDKQFFFDGIMGWFSLNGGEAHKSQMNEALRGYAKRHSIEDLNENFKLVFEQFMRIIEEGSKAENQLNPKYSKEKVPYSDIFVRCARRLIVKMDEIKSILPRFNPGIKNPEEYLRVLHPDYAPNGLHLSKSSQNQ